VLTQCDGAIGIISPSCPDVVAGAYLPSVELPRIDATGVWWLIFVFFAPLVVVSLPLIVCHLYARRGEPLEDARFVAEGLSCRPKPASFIDQQRCPSILLQPT
jgi:hypothetical protein